MTIALPQGHEDSPSSERPPCFAAPGWPADDAGEMTRISPMNRWMALVAVRGNHPPRPPLPHM